MTSGIWRTQRWKGLTMEDVYLTNRDYVKIKNLNLVSYGGNQNWSKSKKMQKVGCGVIAMADLTMYLAEQNPNMMTDAIRKINKPKGLYNKHDYLEYVRFFYSTQAYDEQIFHAERHRTQGEVEDDAVR